LIKIIILNTDIQIAEDWIFACAQMFTMRGFQRSPQTPHCKYL